jgi:uncharacterized protein involved in exopolysaccharide biosynthesis
MEPLDTGSQEDEIDLYPYWMAIKKRWIMIISLVLITVIGAYVFTRHMPRIYRIDALINPGRAIDSDGRPTTVANLADINQMISSGSLQKKIVKPFIKSQNSEASFNELSLLNNLTAQTNDRGEYISLNFESSNPEQGIKILKQVILEIQSTFNPRVENFHKLATAEIENKRNGIADIEFQEGKIDLNIKQLKKNIERKKELTQSEIRVLTDQKSAIANKIKTYQQRIESLAQAKKQLNVFADSLEQNTRELMKGKTELSKTSGNDNTLALLLFSNNIQENINSLSRNKAKIYDFEMEANDAQRNIDTLNHKLAETEGKIKKAKLKSDAKIDQINVDIQTRLLDLNKRLPAEIAKIQSDIQGLEARRSMTEEIQVISEPDYINQPIQSKRDATIAIAVLSAFLIGILGAILMERPMKH